MTTTMEGRPQLALTLAITGSVIGTLIAGSQQRLTMRHPMVGAEDAS